MSKEVTESQGSARKEFNSGGDEGMTLTEITEYLLKEDAGLETTITKS